MHTVRKTILAGAIVLPVLAAYEIMSTRSRIQNFDEIQVADSKTSVLERLGKPFNIHKCYATDPVKPLIYSDNMCKNSPAALEVYSFENCRTCAFFAPGWFNVAFDGQDNVVEKYSIQSP